jgi:hypothetical protein
MAAARRRPRRCAAGPAEGRRGGVRERAAASRAAGCRGTRGRGAGSARPSGQRARSWGGAPSAGPGAKGKKGPRARRGTTTASPCRRGCGGATAGASACLPPLADGEAGWEGEMSRRDGRAGWEGGMGGRYRVVARRAPGAVPGPPLGTRCQPTHSFHGLLLLVVKCVSQFLALPAQPSVRARIIRERALDAPPRVAATRESRCVMLLCTCVCGRVSGHAGMHAGRAWCACGAAGGGHRRTCVGRKWAGARLR